jgi:D-alanyl-D-alanine carboxypeptidase
MALCFMAAVIGTFCARPAQRTGEIPPVVNEKLRAVLTRAGIPEDIAKNIVSGENEFLSALSETLQGDSYLRLLVDKQHPVSPLKYKPSDLVELTNYGAFRVSREGLLLRYPAAVALEKMARAAREEGVTLLVSSTWRSYEYQEEVYSRNVRQSGRETADRESARPGYSQHQLGLAIDFGSITDAFAATGAGKWLASHASEFGWSLSFPDGYESLTGYRWESWHYRYLGLPLTRLQDAWFNGIQQYTLQFINEWEAWDAAPRQ